MEDNAPIRERIVELLVDEGYLASEARDGHEPLRFVREQRPEVIVLDLMMSVMNGWEFLAEQRENTALAEIPVVVLSSVSPDRVRTVEHVPELIPKPFEIALLEAVDRHAAAA